MVQIVAVAVIATASAFIFETPRLDLPAVTWGAIGFTGAVATSFVFTLQVYVQRFTTPTHTALLFSLEPVSAALFGWWWASEILGPKELLGCALILAGMVMAELGGAREAPHGQAPRELEARRELPASPDTFD
ncbi:MAG: DMT family transporter [Anaerolineae bacterium]|nr:DMT family transporter [Anaerolineae bacterium]